MSEEWSKLLETLKTVNHDLITANEVLTAERDEAIKRAEAAENECRTLENALMISKKVADSRAKRLKDFGVVIRRVYPATGDGIEDKNARLTNELEIATKALEGQIKVSERYQLQLDEATQEVDGKRAEVVRLREALVQNRDTSYQTYVLMINLKMQGLSLPNDDGTCELKRLGNDAKNAYMDADKALETQP